VNYTARVAKGNKGRKISCQLWSKSQQTHTHTHTHTQQATDPRNRWPESEWKMDRKMGKTNGEAIERAEEKRGRCCHITRWGLHIILCHIVIIAVWPITRSIYLAAGKRGGIQFLGRAGEIVLCSGLTLLQLVNCCQLVKKSNK